MLTMLCPLMGPRAMSAGLEALHAEAGGHAGQLAPVKCKRDILHITCREMSSLAGLNASNATPYLREAHQGPFRLEPVPQ